mgnify:CR=1 FL=1
MSNPNLPTFIFDLDDTLIETYPVYKLKKAEAVARISDLGLDTTHAQAVLEDVERANVKKYGFSKERFPRSLAKLYGELCKRQQVPFDGYEAWKIEGLGWSIYDHQHHILAGAHEVLRTLQTRGHKLICFTKGDVHVQTGKVVRAQLHGYFDAIEVAEDKNADAFLAVCSKHNLSIENTIMVGDSIKSDINPAASLGIRAIWIPPVEAWSFEVEAIHPNHTQLNHLREVLDLQLTPVS